MSFRLLPATGTCFFLVWATGLTFLELFFISFAMIGGEQINELLVPMKFIYANFTIFKLITMISFLLNLYPEPTQKNE